MQWRPPRWEPPSIFHWPGRLFRFIFNIFRDVEIEVEVIVRIFIFRNDILDCKIRSLIPRKGMDKVHYTVGPFSQVLLYGPDLREIKADTDFARIVLLRVGVLDDDNEKVYRILKDIEFAKYHVYPEGYMVRISPENYREQIRVSKQAIRKGISFRSIGCSYIKAYKKDANVLNATVIFVTAPGLNYAGMKDTAKKASDITNTLTTILEGIPTDCSVCSLKGICDEVEGMKELHFGVGAGGTEKKH